MADERVVSEIVTKFLLNTCRLRPQLTRHDVQAVSTFAVIATVHPRDDAEADIIPLVTGSVAEFYIEPMLPLVGDIDVMHHCSTSLAIPRGHPPPTQLPDEFHNYVKVFEIVDSHLPGYVYLELRYLLTECIEDDKYNYFECDREMYLSNRNDDDETSIHGPALLTDNSHTPLLSVDAVRCVRCLSWPPQAADWPTRYRNYDWPDSATVDRVVSNGCDVVGVAHRQCKQHEWMGKRQWRLSFSRAEIVLINSWMPVQQIVYHMLRVFMKNELLKDTDASEALSNYHIKTLMLWAGELNSNGFWTTDLDLIQICVKLLHRLSVCLTEARCPHYFINNCNLVHICSTVPIIASQLKSIDEAWLSTWFVNNYIQKCALRCSDSVSSLFTDVGTHRKLQNAVSAVVNWRLNTAREDTWDSIQLVEALIPQTVYNSGLTVRSCICWMTELPIMYAHLPILFTAVAFLHIANKISKTGFTDELMDVLATLAGQFVSTRRHPSLCSSEPLSKATRLMKVVANSSRSTMQLIEIELSKAYLHRALRCKDSDSDSVYCLANVYLAVLYYTRGQYQTAIDHCTLVTMSQDHSQCSSHVVQGELLPKIDDDIDNVIGLAVFYQYVRTAALNQRQTQHVSVFTTELFAHYLNIRCLLVTKTLSGNEIRRFTTYYGMIHLFLTDVLAVKSIIHSFHYNPVREQRSQQPTLCATCQNTDLIDFLKLSAVEYLTTYRQLEARDFDSEFKIATTDFEALYAYKHGNYQRCLQMTTRNVATLLQGVNVLEVRTLPEFIQLLDDDIVSLSALTLIVKPDCRRWIEDSCISQITLSLYLMTQCQLKLRYSMTSLAQTLNYIELINRRHPACRTLDHLILKMMKQKVLVYLLNSVTTSPLPEVL